MKEQKRVPGELAEDRWVVGSSLPIAIGRVREPRRRQAGSGNSGPGALNRPAGEPGSTSS
jgi:hypothetical protein